MTISSTNYADSTVSVVVTLVNKTDAGASINEGNALTKTYGDAAFTLTASAANSGDNGAWTWESSNTGVATVTSEGVVAVVGGGTTTITASYESGTTIGDAFLTLTVNPKSVAIPTAASGLKWTGSEQTGVADGEGYTVTDGAATAVGNYTATATLDNTANYKWSDGTTGAKSIPWSIGKADGPAAPTGLAGVAPTTDGGSDGRITGVTTKMEYSTDGSSYTPCSGTKITGLSAGTYSVRYKETATHEAGAAATVSVPAYNPPAPGTVATPTFSPAGGTFTSAQNVTISCATDGATIHYTTDGTTPTESSPTYSAPIRISATTTIKAIAVKSGWTNSAAASATFTLKSSGNGGSGGGSTGGSSGGSSAPATPSSTTTNADGSTTTTTTTTTAKDGSATTTEKAADGSTGTVKTDAQGNTVSAEAAPSAKAISDVAAKGEAVTLPVAVKATTNAASAAPVSVTLPAGSENVTVEIPVENLTAGTVAVIVHTDGTEEIVKTSTTSEDGVVLTLDGSATVKIVDNTKSFGDVTGSEWYADSVAWAASHEVMNGMGDGDFSPDSEASRAQIAQLLFNLDGAKADGNLASFGDVNAGDWYADAVTWMVENGIASGMGDDFGANEDVTREQLAVMLYNYAKYKGYNTTVSGSIAGFPDAGDADGYVRSALAWAVGVGLINGTTDENGNIVLDPQGSATRAQIAAIIERFCEKVAR